MTVISPDLETSLEVLPSPLPSVLRCGRLAIVGRPNVGKSTLLNALVGQKISITSRRSQTTRHRIMGILTRGPSQFVFVDTPGFQITHTAALNHVLNKTVHSSLDGVDVVLFVVQAGLFLPSDERVLTLLQQVVPAPMPIFLVANKLDLIRQRADLAPWLQGMGQKHQFAQWIPLSARRPADITRLLNICEPYLPEQAWAYAADELTDRSERFLVAEIVREKLFRQMGDEVPYTSTVQVEKFEEKNKGRLRHLTVGITVERPQHKGMLIGRGGHRLKQIGTEAREDLEKLWGIRIFLELWVHVRSGWADDEAKIRSFGYGDGP
jgi:GTP-binding protein Era